MLKLLGVGGWGIICALAALFGVVTWQHGKQEKHTETAGSEMLSLKTHNISVPMLGGGQVEGYVVAKFEFSADAAKLKASAVSPESLVADEAFKLIYAREVADVKGLHTRDLKNLTDQIEQGVNQRAGDQLVKFVLIDSWTYLSKEDVVKQNDRVEN